MTALATAEVPEVLADATRHQPRARASLAAALAIPLTTDAGELGDILEGYVRANLWPFAVRLGTQLFEQQALRPTTR